MTTKTKIFNSDALSHSLTSRARGRTGQAGDRGTRDRLGYLIRGDTLFIKYVKQAKKYPADTVHGTETDTLDTMLPGMDGRVLIGCLFDCHGSALIVIGETSVEYYRTNENFEWLARDIRKVRRGGVKRVDKYSREMLAWGECNVAARYLTHIP